MMPTASEWLAAGEHWFWVLPLLKESASIDGRIDASVFRVKIGGKVLTPLAPPEKSSRYCREAMILMKSRRMLVIKCQGIRIQAV